MMLYAPSRRLLIPPGPELLPYLSPKEWEVGTRPWHKDPRWVPGRAWYPGIDTQRKMHALGIIFPGSAAVRREVTRSSAAVGPTATPMHFWRLEEASGNRVDTGTTAGFDLTPTGTPGNATGLIGSAAQLTGGTKHLDWSGTQFALGSGVSVTFAIWAKFTSFNASEVGWGSQMNAGFSQGWWLGDSGSGTKHPRIYTKPNGQSLKLVDDSGITFSTGTWYFSTYRFSTSDNIARVRTNDSSEATVSCSAFIVAGGTLAIGNGGEGVFPDGLFDAAAYFSSSISASDMTALYNSGAGVEYYSGAWH